MGWLYFLLIGLAAGFLAAKLMRGKSLGLFANLGVGVVGAYLGGYLLKIIGVSLGGLVGSLITALLGASLLLWVAAKLR